MTKQILFMDRRLTRACGTWGNSLTPYRMELLRSHIKDIVSSLLDKCSPKGAMMYWDLAEPLPAL